MSLVINLKLRGFSDGTVTAHVMQVEGQEATIVDRATDLITAHTGLEIKPNECYVGFRIPGESYNQVAIASRKNGKALAIFVSPTIARSVQGYKTNRYSAIPHLCGFLVPAEDVILFLHAYLTPR